MGHSSNSESLYFEARSSDRLVTTRPINNEEPVVKYKGENKWSADGYKDKEQEKPLPLPSHVDKKATSMSSEDYKKNNSMSSQSSGVYRPEEPKNIANFDEYGGQKIVQQPKKELDDPAKKEREAIISGLFQGNNLRG